MRRSYCLLSAAVLLALGVIGLAVPTREPAPPAVTEAPAARTGPGAPRARRDRAEAGRDARDRAAPDRRRARRRGGDRGRAARQRQHATPRPRRAAQRPARSPTASPPRSATPGPPPSATRSGRAPTGSGRSARCGPTWTRAWSRSPARCGTRSSRAWSGSARPPPSPRGSSTSSSGTSTSRPTRCPATASASWWRSATSGDVFLGYGDVLIAQYASVGRSLLTSVAFDDTAGRREYYDASGRSVKKMFLRAPLDFTRVTSGFSHARFHPVLGGYRPHLAVDYGAPIGTPVRAVADGVVTQAGWNGGYGISISLRHGRGYETMYNHLSKIDVRPGRAGAPAPGHRPGRQHRPVHRARISTTASARAGSWSTRWARSSSPARPCPPTAAGRSRCTSTPSWSGSTRRLRSPRVHRDDPEAAHRLQPLLRLRQAESRGRRGLLLLRGAAARAVGLRPGRRPG